jgi:hypothetical protein
MSGIFRETYSIEVPQPVETLVAVLQARLTPPRGWGEWIRWSFTQPFSGRVDTEGCYLHAHFGKMDPRVRGTFVPLEWGTRVDLDVSAMSTISWVLMGVVCSPLLAIVALGLWLMVIGYGLGVCLVAVPLAMVGVISLALVFSSLMALRWTRTRLMDWLSDCSEFEAEVAKDATR